jgi:acetyl-CoA synthetase
MIAKASLTSLISPGFDAEKANHLFTDIQTHAAKTWFDLQPLLRQHHVPFHVTLALFKQLHPTWPDVPAPAWQPDETTLEKAPLMHFMKAHGLQSVEATHAYSVQENQAFWKDMLKTLNIQFKIPPTRIVDLSAGTASPQWFPESKLNIIDSCFNAPAEKIAILDDDGQHHVSRMTYGELNRLSNQIANGRCRCFDC